MKIEESSTDLKSVAVSEDKKLFIETYGCQMNVADSEVVASIMKMDGYDLTDKIEEADVFNTSSRCVRKRNLLLWAYWAVWPNVSERN